MVASGLPDRQDILMAWTEGHDHVKQHRAAVSQFVEEALRFMEKDDFGDLDGAEKVAYWETYTETENALEGVDSRISFYRTLSLIEHTEQTIGFLWPILKRHRNVAMRKEDAGELVSR